MGEDAGCSSFEVVARAAVEMARLDARVGGQGNAKLYNLIILKCVGLGEGSHELYFP